MQPQTIPARRTARRIASPVRVSLAGVLGGHVDGAWWPRTSSIAHELPDLIDALNPALGEIVDIDINWSAHSPTPVLSTMSPDVAARMGRTTPHHRLMVLTGRSAFLGLLVVPSMTAPALAMMVLRRAAEREIADSEKSSKEFQTADRVLRAAQVESASWAASRNAPASTGAQVDQAD